MTAALESAAVEDEKKVESHLTTMLCWLAQYEVAEEGEDRLPPGCYSGGEEELQQENLSTQAKFNPLGRAEFDCGWPSTVQCSF